MDSTTTALPGAPATSAARSAATARISRWWRGRPDDPAWARPALLALLVGTAVLYLFNLTANGWANSFYSAAVQAGSESWKAFFFGSSDSANAITVDKPPGALWPMALSVRLFGLSSFSILLPQVLMGVATVGVVYATVRRTSGLVAGLLSGVVLALTPVALLMFRFNNPDALLTLLMALGAWATVHAIEKGSIKWMALVGVFIGLGFLTKTLQVFLVVPFFGIAWVVAARTTLRRRVIGAFAGVGAMLLAGGWWVAIVELMPVSARPYIGGSQNNSFLELTFGYNGLGRINGNETGSVGGGGGGARGGGGGWGETGWDRMFNAANGGQISWLIPSAVILLVVGLVLRGRAPRTDLRRAAYLVWGGWLLVTMATFSFMAGIFHEYYTVALAPAVAALVGMGGAQAWERRRTPLGTLALAGATAAAAVWAFVLLGRTTVYPNGFRVAILVIGVLAAAVLLAVRSLPRRVVPVVLLAGVVAALAGPTAYGVTTVQESRSGSIISAGPSTGGPGGMRIFRGGPGEGGVPPGGQALPAPGAQGPGGQGPQGRGGQMPGGQMPGAPGGQGAPGQVTSRMERGGSGMGGLLNASAPNAAVVNALKADASDYTWVAAAIGSQNAAGLQLGTQLPVMSIGGFNGSDPSPTLAQFQEYVKQGKIHYFAGSGGFGGGAGGSGAGTTGEGRVVIGGPGGGNGSAITAWVQDNYKALTIRGSTFYDLTQPSASR